MRNISVKKFGGSSFRSAKSFLDIAMHIVEESANVEGQVIVVSAPPGMTESWRALLDDVNDLASDRIYGGLLPRADTISAYILSAALEKLNKTSSVLTADLLGITTNEEYCNAEPININFDRLRKDLKSNRIVLIPGGQAVSKNGDLTWLGKNSSDLSAILIASQLNLSECEIYSDVSGVFSADPNKISETFQIKKLSFDEAQILSISGSQVLHHRAVQYAAKNGVELICRRNQHPFEQGSTIGYHGGAKVVVGDELSKIFLFQDENTMLLAQNALLDKNIPFISLSNIASYTLAVTCGFSRPEHIFAEMKISFEFNNQKLLSILSHGDVKREICADIKELKMQVQFYHNQFHEKSLKSYFLKSEYSEEAHV